MTLSYLSLRSTTRLFLSSTRSDFRELPVAFLATVLDDRAERLEGGEPLAAFGLDDDGVIDPMKLAAVLRLDADRLRSGEFADPESIAPYLDAPAPADPADPADDDIDALAASTVELAEEARPTREDDGSLATFYCPSCELYGSDELSSNCLLCGSERTRYRHEREEG